MVWGLFPADPLSGEAKYYIFAKGTYKVGRKGCDVTITKDKGVSRVHAEILIDEMKPLDLENKSSSITSGVRVRDCSKYGTFISRNGGPMEKVHECRGKETVLKDGDLISFGTGCATYRFSFVPLVFFLCNLDASQIASSIEGKVSSIGARASSNWTTECTHVIVDQLTPVTKDLIDAILSKQSLVLHKWLELVAGKRISTEIPSCNDTSYVPTLTLDGASVEVADSKSREGCFKGYTFLLDSANMYRFQGRLQSLLEVSDAKVLFIEDFDSNIQAVVDGETNKIVHVIPAGSTGHFDHRGSLTRINESKLICAAISGKMDPSVLSSPSIVVSSSCSTDETIVADSDPETETATSNLPTTVNASNKTADYVSPFKTNKYHPSPRPENFKDFSEQNTKTAVRELKDVEAVECENDEKRSTGHDSLASLNFRSTNIAEHNREAVGLKENDPEIGNLEILYSQNLIVRDTCTPASSGSLTDNRVLNFKRFKKTKTQSGNSFSNLVPFSKYAYTDSDYDKEMREYVKEEKKRTQMEAMAEDLFNTEKGRRRGVAGSLHGLLSRH